jgi:hypothetical protein
MTGLPVTVVAISSWSLEELEPRRQRLVLPEPAQTNPSWDQLPAVRHPTTTKYPPKKR